MFGSTNPFGQSSTNSPFGSQSVFGQNNNANNNPFAPKPFGSSSTSPFGGQTGGSIFGSNSTGVFGATQASSPLGSTTAFGASSTPAFGASSTPAFGASSTNTFGSSSSAFGGSSVFGQKPAFGGFGSTPTQSSPFGFQASQPAFGSSVFGSSTAFGAPSQPAFGASSTPAFGATSSPAFGATNTPAFGSTASPGFGSSSPSIFGASSTPAFGASSTPAFGASSTPAFGASSTPAFGASSTPSFSFGPSPAFGQSTSAFGSSPFGAAPSAFASQSSPFGAQATTPTFGNTNFGQQQAFGGQRGGSRVASYTPTTETDVAAGAQAGKLESISAMPVYKDKSHEELRWEDYQSGDKGGPNPAGQAQTAGAVGFGTSTTSSNPFTASSPFGQTSSSPFSTPVASNPFSTPSSTNPFAAKSQPFGTPGFGTSTTSAFNSSPFGASSLTNAFGATSSTSPSLFGSSAPFGGGTSTSIFGASSSSAFGSSPSLFGSASAQGSAPAFGGGFGNTQSSPLFQSNAASLGQTSAFGQTGSAFGQTNSAFGQTSSPFGQTSSPFGQTSSPFGQTSSPFGQTSTPFGQTGTPFGQTSLFNRPSTGFGGNMGFGQTTSSLSTPFQSAHPTQASGFGNLGQTQTGTAAFGGSSNLFGQSAFGQSSAPQSVTIPQPAPMTNPYGTLPPMPQMSIGRTGASPSIQYGISSMPVVDKPAPVRVSSLLTSRHLSQRRLRMPARKYHPQNEGPKAFGGQRGGSRVASYTPTTETDFVAGVHAGKLESVSAMLVYKDKSHEELRWEDYQSGDKGGPNPAGQAQTAGAVGFGTSTTSSNPFTASSSSAFGQTSSSPFSTPVASNPFSTPSSTNPFAAKSQPFGTPGFGTSTTSAFNTSTFGASSTTNALGATSSTSPSLFGSSAPFGGSTSTSIFGASSSSAFGSSPSLFGSASAQGSAPAFGGSFGNTQPSPLFQSNAASLGQTSAFGQTSSAFGQTNSAFGQTSSPFGQTSLFNTPSTGFGYQQAILASLLTNSSSCPSIIDLTREDDDARNVVSPSTSLKELKRRNSETICESSNPRNPPAQSLSFVCDICFDPKPLTESFCIEGCTHLYCKECMSSYVAAKVQDSVPQIGCPSPGCQGILESDYCREILPLEMFERWGNIMCESVIGESEKFYCPFKDCSALLLNDADTEDVAVITQSECPYCNRLFCAQCKCPWHLGIECSEFQQLNEAEREKEDIMLMNLAKDKKWKRCPQCKMFVEKSAGCMNMKCRCQFAFCYNCGAASTSNAHICSKCGH